MKKPRLASTAHTGRSTLAPTEPGTVRLKVETPTGRLVIVGAFADLAGAHHFARDLLAGGAARSVVVEWRSASGGWEPAA